jgi:16S rRNA (adenine1518-N6/adenine1519-N6)-dimethyltransferase
MRGTSETLRTYSITPKKRLGQHFLKDENIAKKIVGALSLEANDTVLEIGPGLGILTRHLLDIAQTVIAVEIDDNVSHLLHDTFGHLDHFHLFRTDILKTSLQEICSRYNINTLKAVGNLPYSITTPVLFFLLKNKREIEKIVVTIQKEVAERIVSPPGRKEYGALSVAIQYHTIPERIFDIPAHAFYPRPKVNSTVLRLTIRERPLVSVQDENLFFRVVRSAFGQRRKMLRNALSGAFHLSAQQCQTISDHSKIDLKRRGETLSLEEFARLSDSVLNVIEDHSNR